MPERNCDGCKNQKIWGCTAKRIREPGPDEADGPENWENPAQMPVTIMGEDSFACPRQTILENTQWWAKAMLFYSMFKKGFLVDRGAVIDQCNTYLEIMHSIDAAANECDAIEQEKARQPVPLAHR